MRDSQKPQILRSIKKFNKMMGLDEADMDVHYEELNE
jgi:hypothetical protein